MALGLSPGKHARAILPAAGGISMATPQRVELEGIHRQPNAAQNEMAAVHRPEVGAPKNRPHTPDTVSAGGEAAAAAVPSFCGDCQARVFRRVVWPTAGALPTDRCFGKCPVLWQTAGFFDSDILFSERF